jgi:hypothetical protein
MKIQIIWLHTCPVLDCLLLYDRTGRSSHMIIASVKVFLLFLIVDIISSCQTIIIDNQPKNRRNIFCVKWIQFWWYRQFFFKKKSWRRVHDNCLKATIFFQDGKGLHSCNITVWALRSLQWESHQHKTVKLKALSCQAYMPRYYQTRPSLSTL